jgi:hypothetical protein
MISAAPVATPLTDAQLAALYPPNPIQSGQSLYAPAAPAGSGQGQLWLCVGLDERTHVWIPEPILGMPGP